MSYDFNPFRYNLTLKLVQEIALTNVIAASPKVVLNIHLIILYRLHTPTGYFPFLYISSESSGFTSGHDKLL